MRVRFAVAALVLAGLAATGFTVRQGAPFPRELEDLTLYGRNRLAGRTRVVVEVAESLPVGGARLTTTWTVYGSGDIAIQQRFLPGDTMLPELPRLGMRLTMPPGFDQVTWFGRGPQENYWDRKTGAAVGLYAASAADLFHPYERPQETGTRSDVRWMTVANASGTGLMAVGAPLLEASALNVLQDHLDEGQDKVNRHDYMVPRRPFARADGSLFALARAPLPE